MTEMFKTTLPYPPSVNSYWRAVTGNFKGARVLLSAKGRDYKTTVAANINRPDKPMTGDLCVFLVCSPPDRRRRDVDNILKATFDALQYAGVYEDDSQIVEMHFKKSAITKGGSLRIEITKMNDN